MTDVRLGDHWYIILMVDGSWRLLRLYDYLPLISATAVTKRWDLITLERKR